MEEQEYRNLGNMRVGEQENTNGSDMQENQNLSDMLEDVQKKEQELQRVQKKEDPLQKQQQKLQQEQADTYEAYVKEMTPTYPLWLNMLKAFVMGGLICVLGQCVLYVANIAGLDEKVLM